jgi:hypothetical protein
MTFTHRNKSASLCKWTDRCLSRLPSLVFDSPISFQLSVNLWCYLARRNDLLLNRFWCIRLWFPESLQNHSCQTHRDCPGYDFEVCSLVHIGIMSHPLFLLPFRWLDTTPTSRVITRVTQDIRACEFFGVWCLDEMTYVFQWTAPYPITSRGSSRSA